MTSHDTVSRDGPRPLEGIRIIDFTTVLAGPYCTYQLALLGADVIKVERPGNGDFTREIQPLPDIPGLSAGYVAQNASKRSIVLDLKSAAGLAIAHTLIDGSDVVVENFSPGVADRIGIGSQAMCARNPRLVYASLSGYGQDGPYSPRPAYDHVVQAMSGVTMLTGGPETVPNRIGPPLFDYLAGIYGAFAVVSALMERSRTGQGQRIDIAMLDAAVVAMASYSSALLNAGIEPTANGNVAASGSPASGIFETRDGLLSLAANNEQQVARLCTVLGMQSLLDDTRFAEPAARKEHANTFRAVLSERLLQRAAAEWESLLSAQHVPAARVRTLSGVLADPHMAVREVQRTVTDPVTGREISVPTIGFKWNGHSVGPQRAPSRLGADTEDILREIGIDPDEIERLHRQRVI